MSIKTVIGGISVGCQAKINRSIVSAYVNDDGYLVLVLSDKTEYIVGKVRGRSVVGIFINSVGHLICTMDDGEVIDAGLIPVGHTDEEKDIILNLFANAAYKTDMSAQVSRLAALFGREVAPTPEYRLSLHLTNIKSSVADGTKLPYGSSFAAEITANDGYTLDGGEITVTMGGKVVNAYANGMVSIDEITGDVDITGYAVAAGEKTHTVSLRLTGMSANTASEITVNDGDPFACVFTPEAGYKLDGADVQIHMGSEDISAAYDNGKVYIPAVTGDVQIVASAVEKTKFRVGTILQGATLDNKATEVYEGSPYSAKVTFLTTHTDHNVSVAMGGVSITNTAYTNGNIYIPAVTGDIVIIIRATSVHKVTFSGGNCTTSNMPSTVVDGESLSFEIQANQGYTMDGAAVEILMGDVDVTENAYKDGNVTIGKVTNDVHVTAVARQREQYSVTHNLTNITASNPATTVLEGNNYTTELIPAEGYSMTGASVKVLMGGKDITINSYNNGVVVVRNVTGNIEITAAAKQEVYYDIFVNKTNCVASNNGGSVLQGSTFQTLITPINGYVLQTLRVTMGGTDITSLAVNGTMVTVKGVSGTVVVDAVAVRQSDLTCTVSVKTTNCTCTVANGTMLVYGSTLSGRFTTGANYSMHGATVQITMGGIDITSEVYDKTAFAFDIPAVNGDITITAATNTSIS